MFVARFRLDQAVEKVLSRNKASIAANQFCIFVFKRAAMFGQSETLVILDKSGIVF